MVELLLTSVHNDHVTTIFLYILWCTYTLSFCPGCYQAGSTLLQQKSSLEFYDYWRLCSDSVTLSLQ